MSQENDYLLMFEKPERDRHSQMWASVINEFPWYSAIRIWQFIAKQSWLDIRILRWVQGKGKSCKQYISANQKSMVVKDILGQGISPYHRELIKDTERDAW